MLTEGFIPTNALLLIKASEPDRTGFKSLLCLLGAAWPQSTTLQMLLFKSSISTSVKHKALKARGKLSTSSSLTFLLPKWGHGITYSQESPVPICWQLIQSSASHALLRSPTILGRKKNRQEQGHSSEHRTDRSKDWVLPISSSCIYFRVSQLLKFNPSLSWKGKLKSFSFMGGKEKLDQLEKV